MMLSTVLMACSDSSKQTQAADKPSVTPGEVYLGSNSPKKAYIKTASLNLSQHPLLQPQAGKISYNESQTTRISSPITGRVIGSPISLGSSVSMGASLLELDSPDAATAEADFTKAQADVTLATRAYARQQELYAGKAISQKELEQTQDTLTNARSELQRTQNRLKNLHLPAQQGNGRFVLRAPIAGVVTERNVTPGLEVRPDLDTPLFVISDIKKLTLMMEVFEVNLSKITLGQRLSVSVPAYPNDVFPATVEYIGQVLDETTRTVQVRCELPNPDKRLLPGMYATINVNSNSDDLAIMVPLTAIFTEDEANYVFIKLGDDHFQQRKVELGLRLKDQALIKSGLDVGELLVTEGALMLRAEEEVETDAETPTP